MRLPIHQCFIFYFLQAMQINSHLDSRSSFTRIYYILYVMFFEGMVSGYNHTLKEYFLIIW